MRSFIGNTYSVFKVGGFRSWCLIADELWNVENDCHCLDYTGNYIS